MSALRISWTSLSKKQFDDLHQRAISTGKLAAFTKAHNEIVTALRDSDSALAQGEPLYNTRQLGGEVRLWVHAFVSITYVVYPKEGVGWIVKYSAVPESWPF
jgi:hypothetical protein